MFFHFQGVSFIDPTTWAVLVGDDLDGDGWPAAHGDCDDTNATIYPCAPENGSDTIDEDCNGKADYDGDADGIDDAVDCDALDPDVGARGEWYPDDDGDGTGDREAEADTHCDRPEGHVADNTDCDDTNAAIHPGAIEVCDGADNDCDNTADRNSVDAPDWYYDRDRDGDGGSTRVDTAYACEGQADWATTTGDCDDHNPRVHPGAREYVGDGLDQDCDGLDAEGHDPPVRFEHGGCYCGDNDVRAATTPLLLLPALAWRRRRRPGLHPRA